MQKGTLFIAPLGARNKKDVLFNEIVSLYPDNDFSRVLYLVPNKIVLAEARSRFFSFLGKQRNRSAYVPFHSLTIRHLAESLHTDCSSGNVITDSIRVLILCEILKERNVGYATVLADLSKKIGHYLPERDLVQVKEDIGKLIAEEKASARAVKALEILEEYETVLKGKNLVDTESMLKSSIESIKKTVGRRASGVGRNSTLDARRPTPDVLIIDGFFDPTPLELNIIKSLIDNTDHFYVIAEERTEIIQFLQSCKSDMHTRKLDRTSYRKTAGYCSYPSIEEEVEGIAKNIRKLMIEGIKPWEMTVCFPVLSKYITMLRRIFKKFGIPVSIGELSLSSTRPFTALEEMITCIEEDYSRSDFLSFLTSPHFPAIPAVVKERAVNYSYCAGVVKGKNSWLSIKETLLNSPKDELPEDDRELLNTFQHEIKAVIDIFEDIKRIKQPGLFLDAFESALIKFGFFDSLYTESDVHGDRISDKINRQLSEFRHFAGLYEDGGHSIDSPVFYLRYLLSNLKSTEENRDGVNVLPFELAAGLEKTVLFFGGIIEGDFPSRPDIDPILPERVKKELGIPYLEYYLKRQKKYFMRLLNISASDPYFSCPSADGDKIFLPSPFLDWEQGFSPPELNIFSEEDVLLREGAFKPSAANPDIFNSGEMFRSKKERAVLFQRIGRMTKGFFGVTNIDYFRKCPLRFYIERVLGLEVIAPPQFEVESRLWGSLAHAVMEHLYRDGDIEPEIMEEKIFDGLEKGLKQFPIGTFWARVAKEIFQNLLPALKTQENEIRMQGFRPFKVEEKLKADIDGLKLKGKVDRVDRKNKEQRTQNTDNGQKQTVILMDYKTGNIDSHSLQLPLYAAMWRENFSETVEKVGYYSLKEGKVSWYPGKKLLPWAVV
jgi:ATP-dependent helicase/DNAse subunit B